MATAKDYRRTRELKDLLRRDHTLNGGILFGLEGHIIDVSDKIERPFILIGRS